MTSKNTRNQHSAAQWVTAKAEARAELVSRARRRELITYIELCGCIKAIAFDPDDAALHEMLGEVSSDEDGAGRGMLTAIVVLKTGPNAHEPGNGFFVCAKGLGHQFKANTIEKLAFWAEQVKKVFTFWTTHPTHP